MMLTPPWEFDNPSCAEIGVDLFYRDSDNMESNSVNEQNQVREICNDCPCKSKCADWGIYRERWGIWGGLTPGDRDKIRRRMRRNREITEKTTLLP